MTVLSFERLLAAPGDAGSLRSLALRAVGAMRESGALWAEVAEGEDGLVVLSEWSGASDLERWERSEGAEDFVDQADVVVRLGEEARAPAVATEEQGAPGAGLGRGGCRRLGAYHGPTQKG